MEDIRGQFATAMGWAPDQEWVRGCVSARWARRCAWVRYTCTISLSRDVFELNCESKFRNGIRKTFFLLIWYEYDERGSRLWPWKSRFRAALKCKHERGLTIAFFLQVCVDRERDRAVTLINNHLIISLNFYEYSVIRSNEKKKRSKRENN